MGRSRLRGAQVLGHGSQGAPGTGSMRTPCRERAGVFYPEMDGILYLLSSKVKSPSVSHSPPEGQEMPGMESAGLVMLGAGHRFQFPSLSSVSYP